MPGKGQPGGTGIEELRRRQAERKSSVRLEASASRRGRSGGKRIRPAALAAAVICVVSAFLAIRAAAGAWLGVYVGSDGIRAPDWVMRAAVWDAYLSTRNAFEKDGSGQDGGSPEQDEQDARVEGFEGHVVYPDGTVGDAKLALGRTDGAFYAAPGFVNPTDMSMSADMTVIFPFGWREHYEGRIRDGEGGIYLISGSRTLLENILNGKILKGTRVEITVYGPLRREYEFRLK